MFTARCPTTKAAADRCDHFGRLACDLGVRAARQAHCKHRTSAHLARHGDAAAHHGGVGLAELLKQLRLLPWGHAYPGVGDG